MVDRGKMVDPGDIAGLKSFLDKADQLETNFVTVSGTSLSQEKKLLAEPCSRRRRAIMDWPVR